MRQEKNNRSNRQDQEQARKRNQATRNAGQMAKDLLTTPLDPLHDYAHDLELGTYVDARERYDHLYGETVRMSIKWNLPKRKKLKGMTNQSRFAKEAGVCQTGIRRIRRNWQGRKRHETSERVVAIRPYQRGQTKQSSVNVE